ncbi:MAG: hypothetical protein ACREJ3_10535 [Polyangiaceae bacterium]
MNALVAYLVSAMMGWVPLRMHAPLESRDDARARYESIAEDAAAIAMDPEEAPLFGGSDGRLRTALLMLSVASYESGYRKKVDDGRRLGDGGHSFCLMQIRVGRGVTLEGWTGWDLIRDRQRCFRAGLRILRTSFGTCRAFPMDDRVSAYVTGHCLEDSAISRSRMYRARAWRESHAMPRSPGTDT